MFASVFHVHAFSILHSFVVVLFLLYTSKCIYMSTSIKHHRDDATFFIFYSLTSSNRFCKSGMDLVLGGVADVPAGVVDEVPDVVAFDWCWCWCWCCFSFCDASFSFWSSNITCLKYSIGGTCLEIVFGFWSRCQRK